MKFYIHTLGCKVNAYESRVMADLLANAGYIENDTDQNVDIVIINTCSVTNEADHKSAKIVRKMHRENKDAILIVTGCFSQANAKDVLEMDGVDIVLGNKNKTKIVSYIEKYIQNREKQDHVQNLTNMSFEPMKLNNFNKTRAFVKIQDGCNNFCSYCIIPYTRGNVRSKKREDVLKEIETLVASGHQEIVLTGIHTGNYGAEFKNYTFSDLLKEIIEIKDLKRLRISSIEMNEINDNVLNLMKKHSVLVDHLHIPLQSGSNRILKEMNRKYTKEEFIKKIEKIRKIRPNISITTDVIVGFPGETEKDFEEMVDTLLHIRFSKLHVFPYSKRKGTKASLMENQISEKIKKERAHTLLTLSKKLELEYMSTFLHKEMTFIPEVCKDGFLIGHTGNYLLIKVKGTKEKVNKEILVKIKEIDYPYMNGEKVELSSSKK